LTAESRRKTTGKTQTHTHSEKFPLDSFSCLTQHHRRWLQPDPYNKISFQ